jgi:hypothetical protein
MSTKATLRMDCILIAKDALLKNQKNIDYTIGIDKENWAENIA